MLKKGLYLISFNLVVTYIFFLWSSSAVLEGPRNVTPTVLKDSTGLEGFYMNMYHGIS